MSGPIREASDAEKKDFWAKVESGEIKVQGFNYVGKMSADDLPEPLKD